MKIVGLVGGISWVSTIDYYKFINEGINRALGGLSFAECVIYSLNFDDFQRNNTAGNWSETARLILHACRQLEKSGASAIVLCANTAHAVADVVQREIQIPIIHIVTETAVSIKRQNLTRVGLLGTKFTMEMSFYVDKLQEHGVDVLVPPDQHTRDYIQHTLKEELGRGILKPETKREYLRIIQDLVEAGAEGVVLGCTEIPMMIAQHDLSVPVFDTTRIHAEAAVSYMLS